jgi:hypothetical protein
MNILKRSLLTISLIVSGLSAQDKVDAIEAARQAKAAAEKAAADAEAATDAAIEQAAQNAAQGARDKIKQAKLDEEARKVAEAAAAEEAELDAAASAAAEEAKRRMAEELGLEYVPPVNDKEVVEDSTDASVVEDVVEEVELKEKIGWGIGATSSVGLLSGASFSNIPFGATFTIQTPYGIKVGPFDYKVSVGFGSYTGEYDDPVLGIDKFNPLFIGLGGNITVAEFVFVEGHIGIIGEGPGVRGFTGITLEKIMKKSLSLPVNILVGSELFVGSNVSGSENTSGWAGLGLRLIYDF